MLNETSVRCFLTLSQTLSFTETAKIMYMTQQSVSKYIAKMEEDLGFQLFIRTHHYVMLTKAGENFYRLFSEFSTQYGQVLEETKAYYNTLYNSLHIGYLEWLEISSSISKALKTVQQTNPTLKFLGEKHPQYELNELFMDRKLDLIITYKGVPVREQDPGPAAVPGAGLHPLGGGDLPQPGVGVYGHRVRPGRAGFHHALPDEPPQRTQML